MSDTHLHASGFDDQPGERQTSPIPMRVRLIIDRLKPHTLERYVPILYHGVAIVSHLDKRMSKYEQIDMLVSVLRAIPELKLMEGIFEASAHYVFDQLETKKKRRACECRCA